MLVKRFLAWVQTAPPQARAGATAALARGYFSTELSRAERADAVAAMTLALDDPEPCVRRALAEVLSAHPDAPRHLILSLAADEVEIATLVAERSPLLTDGDLVDLVATRPEQIQSAIARRAVLSGPVAAAIAEVGEPPAISVLAARRDIAIPDFSLTRMADRFGSDPAVMQTLLARPDLPFKARFSLMVARFLSFAPSSEPRERALREAQEAAALEIAGALEPDDLAEFAQHLRATSLLTTSLLLRVVICGRIALFHEALADLGRMPAARVAALCAERKGGGFLALCRKIGLPPAAAPVFVAALDARRTLPSPDHAGRIEQALNGRRILGEVLKASLRGGLHPEDSLAVALRRLDVQLAREEARRTADTLLFGQGQLLNHHDQSAPLLLDRTMALPKPKETDPAPLHRLEVEPAPQVASAAPLTAAAPAEEEVEIIVRADSQGRSAMRFSDLLDVARRVAGMPLAAAPSPDAAEEAGLKEPAGPMPAPSLAAERATFQPDAAHPAIEAPWEADWDAPSEAASMAQAPTVTILDPRDLRPADPAQVPAARPSPAAIAALLENAIASALLTVPSPQLGQAVLEVLRPAPVIEGDWSGVPSASDFDPERRRRSAAA
jgi:uncharacterized protein (DUF2336 family)